MASSCKIVLPCLGMSHHLSSIRNHLYSRSSCFIMLASIIHSNCIILLICLIICSKDKGDVYGCG